MAFLLSACTAAPVPAPKKELPPWPDDGWKPPVMHTMAEQIEIMERGRHICEFTSKGPCAGMVSQRGPDDFQIHELPDGSLNVE